MAIGLIIVGAVALALGGFLGLIPLIAGIMMLKNAKEKKGNGKGKVTFTKPARPVFAPPKEVERRCPNPEPHRHYQKATFGRNVRRPEDTSRPAPLTQKQQDETACKKRRENMRVLYEAGLLTRDEYYDELARLK